MARNHQIFKFVHLAQFETSWRRAKKKDAEIKLLTVMMVMLTSKLQSAVNGKSNDVMQMKNDKFRNVWWRKVALADSALNRRDLIRIRNFRVNYDKLPETRFNHYVVVGLTWTPRSAIYGWDVKLCQQKRSTDSLDCCKIFLAYDELLIQQQRKRRKVDEVAKIYKKKIRSLSHSIVANLLVQDDAVGRKQRKRRKKKRNSHQQEKLSRKAFN